MPLVFAAGYVELVMENVIEIQLSCDAGTERERVHRNNSVRAESAEQLSIVEWYRVLRMHHHWTMFQAIRYALWLVR